MLGIKSMQLGQVLWRRMAAAEMWQAGLAPARATASSMVEAAAILAPWPALARKAAVTVPVLRWGTPDPPLGVVRTGMMSRAGCRPGQGPTALGSSLGTWKSCLGIKKMQLRWVAVAGGACAERAVVMDQSESAELPVPLWRLESTVLSPYTAPTAGLASASAASSPLRLKITYVFLILFS